MSDQPAADDGTLERTDDGGVIRFERRLPYAISDVWDAITNPERLAEWWLPFDAEITVDLREGGALVFAAKDGAVTLDFTVLRIDPPTLLEHTHADGSFLRWDLEPVDDGCVLRLSHFLTDVNGAIENCYVVGLHASLARLAPCLDRRPIPWDWDGFAEAQAQYALSGLAPTVEAS